MKEVFFVSLILKLIATFSYKVPPSPEIVPKPGQVWQCVVYKCPVFIDPYVKSKKMFTIKLRDKIKVVAYMKSRGSKFFDFIVFKRKGKIYYTPFEYFARYKKHIKKKNLPYRVKIDRWNNIAFNYKPTDLKRIPKKYIPPKKRKYKYYLRKQALRAFIRLLKSARRSGIKLYIASAYRSCKTQVYLYLKDIRKNGPKQKGSAKPTHSEHHLGTTCDLTSKEVKFKLTGDFSKTKAYKWLKKNVKRFNMRITYSKKKHRLEKYMWEPWHVRWLGYN